MQVRGVNTNVFWKNNDENIPSLTYLESIKNEMVEWTNTKVNFVNFTTIEIVSNNTKYDYIMFHDETENIDKYFYYFATDIIANNKCVYTYFLDAVVTYLLPFMQNNLNKQFLTERSYILDKKTIQDTDTFVLNSPKNGTYKYDMAEYIFSNTPGKDTYVREYFEKTSNDSHESLRYTSPLNFNSEINGVLYMGFNSLRYGDHDNSNLETTPTGTFGNIYLIPLLGYDNGVVDTTTSDNGNHMWVHHDYKDSNFKLELGQRETAPSDITPLQTTTFRKVVTKMYIKNGGNTHVVTNDTNSSLSDFLNSYLNNINTEINLSFSFDENLDTSIEIEFGFVKVNGDKNIPNRVLTWDELQQLNQHGTLTATFNGTQFNVTSGKIIIPLQKANDVLNGGFYKLNTVNSYNTYCYSNYGQVVFNSFPPSGSATSKWLKYTSCNTSGGCDNGIYYLLAHNLVESQTQLSINGINDEWSDNYRTNNDVSTITSNAYIFHSAVGSNYNLMGYNVKIFSNYNFYLDPKNNNHNVDIDFPRYKVLLIKENNKLRLSFNGLGVKLIQFHYIKQINNSLHNQGKYGYDIWFNKQYIDYLHNIDNDSFSDLLKQFSDEYITWTPQNQTNFPFTYTQIYNTNSFLSDVKITNEAHFMGFFMLPHVFTFPSKIIKINNLQVNYKYDLYYDANTKYRTIVVKYNRNFLTLQIQPAGIDLTPFRLGSQNISTQPQMLTYNNENMWWYLYKFCETKFMNCNIDLSVYYYTNNDFISNGWFIFAGQGIYVDKVDIYNLVSSTWILPGPLPSMTDEYRAYVNSNINSANAAYKSSVNHLVSGVFNAGATVGLGVLTGGMSFAYSNKLINAAIGMNQNIINTNNTNGWINETFGKTLLAPGQKPLHYLKSIYNLKNVENYLKSAELSKTIGKQQVINGVEHATGGLFNSIVNLVNTRNNIKAQFQDARNKLGVSLNQSNAEDAILESQWLNYQRHYNVVEKFIPDIDTIKNWNNIIYLYGFPGNRMMTFNQMLNKPSDSIMHDCWYIGFNEVDLVQKLPLMKTYNKLPNEIKDYIIEFLKKGVRFWDVNPATIL